MTDKTFGKVGNCVEHTVSGIGYISDNTVLHSDSKDPSIKVLFNKRTTPTTVWLSRLTLLTSEKEVSVPTDTLWQFKSAAKEDIDWELLAKDTTRQNPLLLVEVQEKYVDDTPALPHFIKEADAITYLGAPEDRKKAIKTTAKRLRNEHRKALAAKHLIQYVVIHDSLLAKAELRTANVKAPTSVQRVADNIARINGNFAEWVKWAKLIKAAPWPKDSARKATVTVHKPTI